MKLRDLFFTVVPDKRDNEETAQKSKVIYSCNPKQKYGYVSNQNTALVNSVIYRGLSILSDSVASLPIDIYRKKKDSWEIDEKNTLHSIFTRRANDRQTPYELLEGTIMQLIMYGNAYIYIKRNSNGDISQLVLCYPHTVYHDVVNNKYTITDTYNKIQGTFTADKIIHLRHKSLENIVGKSIVDYCAKTLGIASGVDSEALKNLSNGMRLKGIISNESSVIGFGEATDGQLDDIRDNIQQELQSGNDILSMPSGVKFTAISQNNRDSQIVEQKQYTLSDLARFMGVSLSKLFISQGSNYQVAIQEQISFYEDTFNPLLVKIEQALNNRLISDSVAHKYKIEFRRETLPYYKEILATYKVGLELGIYSVNDIRRIHNQAPIENGDTIIISTNLQTVKSLDNKVSVEENTEEKTEDTDVERSGTTATEEQNDQEKA